MKLTGENITTCAAKISRPLYPEVLILSRKNHSKATMLKPSVALRQKADRWTKSGWEHPEGALREPSVQYEVKDHLD